MSKNIAFVNSSASWGGGEKWHLENAVALQERGYHVEIICKLNSELHKQALEKDVHIRIMDTKNFSFLNPKKLKLAADIIEDFDFAILNSPNDLKLFGKANKGNCKLIYRRGSAIPIKNNTLNKNLLNNKIDLIIANSEATKKTILENGVLDNSDKIQVVFNGINLPANIPEKEIKSKIILGNLGRLVEQKNQLQLIEVAKILDSNGLDFSLLIGGSGKLESKLKKEIKSNNLNKKVKLLGEINDLDKFYGMIDIFLLSSKWEGFGYVIAESFGYKKPVIAFDISSNPELITHNKNGILVKPFDSQKIAEKILELTANTSKIKEMGESGHQFIKDERNFEAATDQLINAIENIK